MTGPNLHVDTDGLDAWSADTRGRAPDLRYRPVDNDGDWPSHRSMRRFQGTVQQTGDQLSNDMDDHANHGQQSSTQYKAQDQGANSAAIKDLMGMGSSAMKDGMGIVTNLGQTATQALTQVGTAVTQAGTTAMTAAMTAATTAGRSAAPGGAPVGLTAGQGSVPDSPTTNHHDGKGRDRDDAHADANS